MRTPIKDSNSQLIGYFKEEGDKTLVYDKNSTFLGEASEKGTFDHNHTLVSRSNVPSLLLSC